MNLPERVKSFRDMTPPQPKWGFWGQISGFQKPEFFGQLIFSTFRFGKCEVCIAFIWKKWQRREKNSILFYIIYELKTNDY